MSPTFERTMFRTCCNPKCRTLFSAARISDYCARCMADHGTRRTVIAPANQRRENRRFPGLDMDAIYRNPRFAHLRRTA